MQDDDKEEEDEEDEELCRYFIIFIKHLPKTISDANDSKGNSSTGVREREKKFKSHVTIIRNRENIIVRCKCKHNEMLECHKWW